MKKIKLKKTLIKKLKSYWKQLGELEDDFRNKVDILEKIMQENINIPGIEFFMVDGDYVGIGNATRTVKLIHSFELE